MLLSTYIEQLSFSNHTNIKYEIVPRVRVPILLPYFDATFSYLCLKTLGTRLGTNSGSR